MHGEAYSKVIDIAIAETRGQEPSNHHWFSESDIDMVLQASVRECAPESHWNIIAMEEVLVRVEGGVLTGCRHIVRGEQGLVIGNDSLHSSRTGCRQNFLNGLLPPDCKQGRLLLSMHIFFVRNFNANDNKCIRVLACVMHLIPTLWLAQWFGVLTFPCTRRVYCNCIPS